MSRSVTNTKEQRGVENFNLKINSGEVVALVGPSGGANHPYSIYYCGYTSQKTAKQLDGKPISHYDHRTFHRLIGVVGQEPNLFAEA